jgi:hypothetical protein
MADYSVHNGDQPEAATAFGTPSVVTALKNYFANTLFGGGTPANAPYEAPPDSPPGAAPPPNGTGMPTPAAPPANGVTIGLTPQAQAMAAADATKTAPDIVASIQNANKAKEASFPFANYHFEGTGNGPFKALPTGMPQGNGIQWETKIPEGASDVNTTGGIGSYNIKDADGNTVTHHFVFQPPAGINFKQGSAVASYDKDKNSFVVNAQPQEKPSPITPEQIQQKLFEGIRDGTLNVGGINAIGGILAGLQNASANTLNASTNAQFQKGMLGVHQRHAAVEEGQLLVNEQKAEELRKDLGAGAYAAALKLASDGTDEMGNPVYNQDRFIAAINMLKPMQVTGQPITAPQKKPLTADALRGLRTEMGKDGNDQKKVMAEARKRGFLIPGE